MTRGQTRQKIGFKNFIWSDKIALSKTFFRKFCVKKYGWLTGFCNSAFLPDDEIFPWARENVQDYGKMLDFTAK